MGNNAVLDQEPRVEYHSRLACVLLHSCLEQTHILSDVWSTDVALCLDSWPVGRIQRKRTGEKKRERERVKGGKEKANKRQTGSPAAQVHVVSVSGLMTLVERLFSRAFKEKTDMWFPLGRQKIERKEVKERKRA